MDKFDKFVEIIATLRGENGCPWDKKQTHDSLLQFLFEETNEVADTIVSKDYKHLQEELGDLLLQIVLHSQIAKENNEFAISDVIDSISEKMIRRHPHIFAGVKVNSEDEVNQLWEEIKKKEQKDNVDKEESILDKIPQELPTLSKTKKIQKEVIKNGFDWPKEDYLSVIGKVKEEIEEIEDAVKNKNFEHVEAEIGDLLFATIHLALHLDVDAETALFKCNDRFSQRFRLVELQAKEKKMKDYSLKELHQFWKNAKFLLSHFSFEEAVKKLNEKAGD
ncbi:MAG: nucleoside triphosphate pyrophosphohydrolase [Spirochaetales bacterium]|nr:nucleoside triphosphate pyrophosphohydrolase [Spirochaetales bacterium]